MLVLVGPSASGKTEILKVLIKKYGMEKLVTYTTRPMRVGEVNGIDYHFISHDEFISKFNNHFFFETVEYNGNFYGTSMNDFDDNKAVILEPIGLQKYIDDAKDKIKIVVLICDSNILKKRMITRGDKPENIEKRIVTDRVWFSNNLQKKADLVLDTSYSDIEDDAKKIYEFYNSI